MLKPRIIPVLLVRNKGLVKTIKFKEPKYVGDPINAVKIFNEKEVDELVVIDIDASVVGKDPDYNMISNLAAECRMPLCYGGGIKTAEQAERILNLGVEKVSLSSSAFNNPFLISELSSRIGSQSVVVTLDIKKSFFGNKYDCFIYNATKNTKQCPFDFAKKAESLGVGEFIINSIDNDGTMKGYDLSFVAKFRSEVSVPITVLGGAGDYNHISQLILQEGIVGASAGSLFVFKGKYRAVLINYPSVDEKEEILSSFSEFYK